MYVTDHAAARLDERLPWEMSNDIQVALEAMAGEPGNVAIEVYREPTGRSRFDPATGSNGDQVIVIARDGSVETVMLRRSWNQPFTAEALSVHRCVRL